MLLKIASFPTYIKLSKNKKSFSPDFGSYHRIFLITRKLFLKKYFQKKWWAQVDLNHRPHAYQACALTS